jgi:L-threonylcarbamoyladenylate synthase
MNTRSLRINIVKPEKDKLEKAVRVLSSGGLVVLPTETVYGIGFDIDSKMAMDKIAEIKKERRDKSYSVAIPDFNWIERYKIKDGSLKRALYLKDLLPGPLTFILEREDNSSIGFRVPDNKVTQRIITLFKKPIYLASANISGADPALSFKEAVDYLQGKVDLIVDGGNSCLLKPSLVLDLTQNPVKILREGSVNLTAEIKRRFGIK